MVVYRICKKEELDKIINGIPFSDIGRTCTNDSKLNNHEYKPNIKYLHFYKDYGSIFYLNVTKDHYICTYDIPDEILAEYVGSGRYLDRVFMKKEEQVGEYAIPSSQIDSSYLQRIDKVIDYIDFEDYLYEDYKDNLETIYKKERLKTNVIFLDFDIRNSSNPPVFVMKTGGFGPSGETRLHLRQRAQIEVRRHRAGGGNARPRCI